MLSGRRGFKLPPIVPDDANSAETPPDVAPPCTPCEVNIPTLPTKLIENLYVGGHCSESDLETIRAEIVYGFNCSGKEHWNIKNLTYSDETLCYDIKFELLAPFSQGQDKESLFKRFNTLINAICQRVRARETVYIHCFAGKDRAPLVAAACLVALNEATSADKAITKLDAKETLREKHSVRKNQQLLEEWLTWRKQHQTIIVEPSPLGCFL